MSYFSLPPEYGRQLHEERIRRLDQASHLRHDRRNRHSARNERAETRRLRRQGA